MRVVAVVPDLLFASRVDELLRAGGHEVRVAEEAAGPDEADVVVVDLASGVVAPEDVAATGVPRLGIYAHVDADMKRRAQDAGFDLVVPRSRMAREGPALVERLVAE